MAQDVFPVCLIRRLAHIVQACCAMLVLECIYDSHRAVWLVVT